MSAVIPTMQHLGNTIWFLTLTESWPIISRVIKWNFWKLIMFSNERPSPYGQQPYFQSNLRQPKLHVAEDTLRIVELQIERKTFVFILKENPRGRFLRIIESGGKNNPSIIVPATGLKDFHKLMADMVKADTEIPARNDLPR
jgi:hypothetical protein